MTNSTKPYPPKFFLRFFRWYCRPKLADHVEGDLIEVYRKRVKKVGKRKADLRFAIDVVLLFRPGIVRLFRYHNSTSYGMYKNYFKTAIRNLLKNKGYSFINVFGLAMGMAVALLIGLWENYQFSYDRFNVHRDHIGIVMEKTLFNNQKGTQTGVMLPLYDELKSHYPEVKEATRLDWGENHSLIVADKKMSPYGHYVDPAFLKMFTFPLVEGSVDKALSDPYSIVLTQSLATALFGKEDAMGKTITLDGNQQVIVTGVARDVPDNSTVHFAYLLPYQLNILTSDFVKNAQTEWANNFLQTLVELNDGVTMQAFSDKIENLVRQKSDNKIDYLLFVHPMTRWHLYNNFEDWENTGGDIKFVRLFSIIGLLVLAIACINFVNLSTARSEKRAKEVGIRKTIGSYRGQLVGQFLGESMLTAVLAFGIAVILVDLTLNPLSSLGFGHISLQFNNLPIVGAALGGCLLTGLVAGIYPAFYLSGFSPVRVLKGLRPGKTADLPRRILVVMQFSVSIVLIIGTMIVFLQIQYGKDRPLGYDPHNLLVFTLTEDLKKNYDPMKNELLGSGYVNAVSRSSSKMTDVENSWDGFSWAGMDPSSHPVFSAIMVDYDYDRAAGVVLKEGRFFSRDHSMDSSAAILNESAVKFMDLKEPVGSELKLYGKPLSIIGVTLDVVREDPFQKVEPAIMILGPYFRDRGLVRFKAGVSGQKAIAAITPIMNKYNPAFPFDYKFTDEEFDNKFSNENQVESLAGIFSLLSILISCLGLFGLASFMAERRVKEIGIRKVSGASIFSLWKLLSKDFVKLVIIACFIAIPASWYFLGRWLEKYTYRVDLSWWVFAGAGISAIAITLLTVSYQSIKAARMNPVNSLRAE